ncbi:hypothetical protein BDN72DRAFT_906691 [Pluteus cervinus]|uniref:Uncharacterized protein n=1 Tax=Pluteus cervinus TaxID=181527 RepID=A0ACD2ZYH6_9AGAR|nr:hypothetical protein BDN72DRAFT_906691 [Pluteus cervinus]
MSSPPRTPPNPLSPQLLNPWTLPPALSLRSPEMEKYWDFRHLEMWRRISAAVIAKPADGESTAALLPSQQPLGPAATSTPTTSTPSSVTYDPTTDDEAASSTAVEHSDAEPPFDDDDLPNLASVSDSSDDEDEVRRDYLENGDSSGAEEPPPSSQSSGLTVSTTTPLSDGDLEDRAADEHNRVLQCIFLPTEDFLATGPSCCSENHSDAPGSERFQAGEMVYQYLSGPTRHETWHSRNPSRFQYVVRTRQVYRYRHAQCMTSELAMHAMDLANTARPPNIPLQTWWTFFYTISTLF